MGGRKEVDRGELKRGKGAVEAGEREKNKTSRVGKEGRDGDEWGEGYERLSGEKK